MIIGISLKPPQRRLQLLRTLAVCTGMLSIPCQSSSACKTARETSAVAVKDITVQHMLTPEGVAFGLHGGNSQMPSPTLFVLCSCTIDTALADHFAGPCALRLVAEGYMCVTIDIPSHGAQRRSDEPEGLEGWNYRAARKEDFVAGSNRRLTSVLNFLIEKHLADPSRVAVCGTSRGGFLALHFAASDARVRCVAAFAPVTDLHMLREFHGQRDSAFVSSLATQLIVDRLASRPTWIVIGDQDERVGTDRAIEFSRALTKSAVKINKPSQCELHVVSEPRGHTLPDHVSADAAEWICAQMK